MAFILISPLVIAVRALTLRPAYSLLQNVSFYVIVVGIIILFAAYRLNRAAHYTLAAVLTVSVTSIATFVAAILDNQTDVRLLGFLVVSVLLSSILLPWRITLVLVALYLAGIALFPIVNPQVTFTAILNPLLLVTMISLFIVISLRHRGLLEKDRQSDLAASEALYRNLFDGVPIGLYRNMPGGRITDANPAMVHMLGYPDRESLLAVNVTDLYVDQDDRIRLRTLTMQDGVVRNFETQLRRADGSVFWAQVDGHAIRDAGGQVLGYEGAVQDVTERKQAEEALRQAQKTESLGVLAGGIAHDFNNLLVAMIGQTSLAAAQLPLGSPARAHIEKAVTAAERAADLTRQMLAYSGRGQFEIRLLDLNKLIQENLHLFEVAVPKHVQLNSELARPLPLISADPGQMQQVIMNLIINAAEAIGERPGDVRVTTGTHEMSADDTPAWQYTGRPLEPGRYVSLTVQDNGNGMDAATLGKIFDPFFTTKFTGRGLGLAAVLGIVRGHKGGLRVESEPGRGTTFKLFFPAGGETGRVSGEEPTRAAPAESEPPNQSASSMILVIDDEEPVREAVTDILEMEGLPVITAASGEEGLRLYRERAADIRLVLLDLSMPGLSGEETFHALKQINPEVRVVVSSGYQQVEATARFEGLGLAGFIQKPYDASTLITEIRRHLS
jgi:PAS domain S-box-containing protein